MLYKYQKYFIKNILYYFLIIFSVAISIIWAVQLLKFLYLLQQGISILDFLSFAIYLLPSILFVTLPIILLISVFLTYL